MFSRYLSLDKYITYYNYILCYKFKGDFDEESFIGISFISWGFICGYR